MLQHSFCEHINIFIRKLTTVLLHSALARTLLIKRTGFPFCNGPGTSLTGGINMSLSNFSVANSISYEALKSEVPGVAFGRNCK
ncbi:hypothetical protein NQ318_015012 [Aromia moschata]|uniref:Uncharacterized protein n=1 Tax=Aromia moschata TaxID=1265417 RepID=A0AAV8YZB4_9CUCU|nr:hypothetical protein NQ318_015012 [Aromia moschata]